MRDPYARRYYWCEFVTLNKCNIIHYSECNIWYTPLRPDYFQIKVSDDEDLSEAIYAPIPDIVSSSDLEPSVEIEIIDTDSFVSDMIDKNIKVRMVDELELDLAKNGVISMISNYGFDYVLNSEQMKDIIENSFIL